MNNKLTVCCGELVHERNQSLYTLDRHCVVDAGSHAAENPVSLKVDESVFLCLSEELGIESLILKDKRNIYS